MEAEGQQSRMLRSTATLSKVQIESENESRDPGKSRSQESRVESREASDARNGGPAQCG